MIILPPSTRISIGTEIDIHGLKCVVEHPSDSVRFGKFWMGVAPAHYGYIKGYKGADNDSIDCYIGTEPKSKVAFVIDQNKLESLSVFDEHKVMLAYDSQRSALRDYLAGHSEGHRIFRGITTVTIRELKRWLREGDLRKPMSRYQNDNTVHNPWTF